MKKKFSQFALDTVNQLQLAAEQWNQVHRLNWDDRPKFAEYERTLPMHVRLSARLPHLYNAIFEVEESPNTDEITVHVHDRGLFTYQAAESNMHRITISWEKTLSREDFDATQIFAECDKELMAKLDKLALVNYAFWHDRHYYGDDWDRLKRETYLFYILKGDIVEITVSYSGGRAKQTRVYVLNDLTDVIGTRLWESWANNHY